MNIFLSWSGERSRAVSDLLDEWLQCVIQAVDPWMSSKDIDRGTLWFSEISDQLQNTSIGIICLTKDNLEKPWILFEAGALAKGLKNTRVCTFLIDLDPNDIGTPLSQFNHTLPNKPGLWALVKTLNNALQEKGLKEKTLGQVFETYWPKFEESFNEIISEIKPAGTIKKRPDKDILMEILETSRSMDRRVRMLENGNIRNANSIEKTAFKHSFNYKVSNATRESVFSMVNDEKYSTDDILEFLMNSHRVKIDGAMNIFKQIMNESIEFKSKIAF